MLILPIYDVIVLPYTKIYIQMDKLNKAVIIMAKIAEVINWIGAALMAVLTVLFAYGQQLQEDTEGLV